MAASAGCHGDQAIHAGLGSFFSMAAGGHVMEHQAAVAVHRIDHFLHRAQAGDDDGHAVFDADGQIRLQAWVAVMHDQIDGIGRGVARQAGFDLVEPGGETGAPRWFSAGKLPTMPLLQQALTSAGLDTRNIGAATRGRRRR